MTEDEIEAKARWIAVSVLKHACCQAEAAGLPNDHRSLAVVGSALCGALASWLVTLCDDKEDVSRLLCGYGGLLRAQMWDAAGNKFAGPGEGATIQ